MMKRYAEKTRAKGEIEIRDTITSNTSKNKFLLLTINASENLKKT